MLAGLHNEAKTSESGAARVRAWELIGKILGIEGLNGTNARPIGDPREMSTSELKRIVDEAGALGYGAKTEGPAEEDLAANTTIQ